jgi:dethiobiotin synthetase
MLKPQQGWFVTGTDTEVGKTFITCRLLEQYRSKGFRVGAYKPSASGAASIEESDAYRLWTAIGQSCPIEWVTPQSFQAPLAPPIAAELEGKSVDESLLLQGVAQWFGNCDLLIVEGAGGLMSPISWSMTNADLARAIGYPLVLVANNRLGVVHQVLATLTSAHANKLRVAEIVLNHVGEEPIDISAESNERLLRSFLRRLGTDIPIRNVGHEPLGAAGS